MAEDPLDAITSALDAASQLVTVLFEDAERFAPKDWTKYEAPERRAYVRASFALFEGTLNSMTRIASYYLPVRPGVFSSSEQLALGETTYLLEENGRVKSVKARHSFLARLRFAPEALARANAVKNPFLFDGEGFAAIRKAKDVRDRLGHPRDAEQLAVTNDEIVATQNAMIWFKGHSQELFLACAARMVGNAVRNAQGKKSDWTTPLDLDAT